MIHRQATATEVSRFDLFSASSGARAATRLRQPAFISSYGESRGLRRGWKTAEQVGPNVVATGSGAIDLTGSCVSPIRLARFTSPRGTLRIITSRYCVVRVLSVPDVVPRVLPATIRK